MTTRKELLDNFEAKLDAEGSFPAPLPEGVEAEPDGRSWVHQTYPSRDGTRKVEWQKTMYWDSAAQNVKTVQFYVTDPGTQNETADWLQRRNPKPDPPEPTFSNELEAYLNARVADDTIEHYSSVSPREETQTATATVLLRQSGNLVEKRVKLWKDADGNAQYEVIQETV